MVAAGVGASAVAARLLGQPLSNPSLAAAGAFGLLGLLDDARGIPVGTRLAVQGLAGAAFAGWMSAGRQSPRRPRRSLPGALGVGAATAGWMAGYVNAFNFMDGIDGISVAQVVVAGGAWSVLGTVHDVPELVGLAVVASGAVLGFAPFNLPTAACFLGDVGSYGLGALLAAGAVVGLEAGLPVEAVIGPLAVYLADTGATLIRRIRGGEEWYRPHRTHAYQRLVQSGWSHPATSAYVAAVMTVVARLGMVSTGPSLPRRLAADLAALGVLVAYIASPGFVERRAKAVGGTDG
jgi:UDP-GlcNAc:undecaprenyl-phosphate GlcNAc-1-phosphate transferase